MNAEMNNANLPDWLVKELEQAKDKLPDGMAEVLKKTPYDQSNPSPIISRFRQEFIEKHNLQKESRLKKVVDLVVDLAGTLIEKTEEILLVDSLAAKPVMATRGEEKTDVSGKGAARQVAGYKRMVGNEQLAVNFYQRDDKSTFIDVNIIDSRTLRRIRPFTVSLQSPDSDIEIEREISKGVKKELQQFDIQRPGLYAFHFQWNTGEIEWTIALMATGEGYDNV